MRFSLQEVKRQVRRRDGELTLTLHFLRPGELRSEIEQLIAYHERHRGQPRKLFAQDEASALVGDYRLAGCLLTTLSAWYTWRQTSWEEALRALSEEARTVLSEAELRSPGALRLALFDEVNAQYSGFLDAQTRPAALEAFATRYQLTVPQLEELLVLDADDEAFLMRTSVEPPEAAAVAALYNQWAFEAALFNASEVRFVIDCQAFLEVQRAGSAGVVTGIGAAIKRLCYLTRKLGVYYDLAYEGASPSLDTQNMLLHLTLYGPQEATGRAQQYGLRLARLCRLLLGYGIAQAPRARARRQAGAALSKAFRRAEATVHVFQNAYRFTMDAELLALLPMPEPEEKSELSRIAEAATIYDSSIEQSFAEAFASLERAQATHGWQLEREPEPLLLSAGADEALAHSILIPDFALTRGARRIYIEILGFWTPAYRERKMQKLQSLRGRADLLLALPREARPAFASLAADYPLVEYHGQLSATALLQVVQERFDDFEERLAALDLESARASVRAAGLVPERACYALLNCYRRAELARAAERVCVHGDIAYLPGAGLYLLAWLEHLHRSFVEWVEAKGKYELSLSALLEECRTNWPELAGCEESALETLIGLWPEVQIRRGSIFEATLVVEVLRGEEAEVSREGEETREVAENDGRRAPTLRKTARERRAGSKKEKRAPQEASQQNLWE